MCVRKKCMCIHIYIYTLYVCTYIYIVIIILYIYIYIHIYIYISNKRNQSWAHLMRWQCLDGSAHGFRLLPDVASLTEVSVRF